MIQKMFRADANKHLLMTEERVDTSEESFDVRIDRLFFANTQQVYMTEKKTN